MARYKPVESGMMLLPVDLSRQLLPGTFEHALSLLIDEELDLNALHARVKNDLCGAPAYSPAVLLKIVLFAYSRGMISSRLIAQACQESIVFMSLSGDNAPHHTTIATFVRELKDEIAHLFTQILFLCDAHGLIGREHFAIDGVKLPSNASKSKSGTRADFQARAAKIDEQVRKMLQQHQAQDRRSDSEESSPKLNQRVQRLRHEAQALRQWLDAHPHDRRGPNGALRKSNRTDNASAKMATSHGVIQGYTGVAAVDATHQIIVQAQAHGTGSEQELLLPTVDAFNDLIEPHSVLSADAGYHSEANLRDLAQRKVHALIADNGMRKRDPRFTTQARHKTQPDPLWNKTPDTKPSKFSVKDFHYDPATQTCICPAGEFLYRNGSNVCIDGHLGVKFTGAKRVCGPCSLRDACLRNADRSAVRQVTFFKGKRSAAPSFTEQMRSTGDALPPWNPCSPTSGITSGSTDSPYAGAPRSTRSGSSTAWCTTSRSWRITDSQGKDEAMNRNKCALTLGKRLSKSNSH